MCRIFGIIQSTPQHSYLDDFIQAASSLLHGGPDSQGFVHFPIGGLGATRLAITGLDGGQQPYIGKLGNAGIYAVLNGQIYNHKQLRKELEAKGHTFTDHCDGSLIPALYEEYGASFPSRLNGMFAIAVLDMRATPTLFLAVDGMGIKPLYYSSIREGIAFCSEIAPLSKLTHTDLSVETSRISEVFSHRIVMSGHTLYQNVRVLQPGHYLSLILGQTPKIGRYDAFHALDGLDLSLQDMLEREIALMTDSETDACFIVSGGVDSSLITALAARRSGKPLSTFHVCTKDSATHNENSFARELADYYGTHHHEVEVDIHDFPALLMEFTSHLGQPDSAPQSLSAFALARTIRNHGFKVAYGGEGADELFGGYSRMVTAHNAPSFDTTGYIRELAPFSMHLLSRLFTPRHIRTYPLYQKPIHTLEDMYAFERYQRLPAHLLCRADHLFMASAVEMRVPFCQPLIQQFAERHTHMAPTAKPLVYEAAQGLVPPSIFQRPKHHFVFPIVDAFKKHEYIRSVLADSLLSARHLERDVFDIGIIEHLLHTPAAELSQDDVLMLFTLAVYELTVRATMNPEPMLKTLQPFRTTPLTHGGHHVTLS